MALYSSRLLDCYSILPGGGSVASHNSYQHGCTTNKVNNRCYVCEAGYHLTTVGLGVSFVTPGHIIYQALVGLDEFNHLNLVGCHFSMPPAFSDRQLMLCIFNVTMNQQVE